jgi:hypothetical protein
LAKKTFPRYGMDSILNQIEAKAKAKHKLPNWFATNKIIYPSKISIANLFRKTANYKAKYRRALQSI